MSTWNLLNAISTVKMKYLQVYILRATHAVKNRKLNNTRGSVTSYKSTNYKRCHEKKLQDSTKNIFLYFFIHYIIIIIYATVQEVTIVLPVSTTWHSYFFLLILFYTFMLKYYIVPIYTCNFLQYHKWHHPSQGVKLKCVV